MESACTHLIDPTFLYKSRWFSIMRINDDIMRSLSVGISKLIITGSVTLNIYLWNYHIGIRMGRW